MSEIWKDVADYEGLYIVSNYGNVASVKSDIKIPRLLKRTINPNGYYIVSLRKDGKARTFLVHRLVAASFIENPENKPFVNHIDGNKKNPRADNLEWVTPAENHDHAMKTGLIDLEYNGRCFGKAFDAYLEKHGLRKVWFSAEMNYSTDISLILWMQEQENESEYLKTLIREDMKRKGYDENGGKESAVN